MGHSRRQQDRMKKNWLVDGPHHRTDAPDFHRPTSKTIWRMRAAIRIRKCWDMDVMQNGPKVVSSCPFSCIAFCWQRICRALVILGIGEDPLPAVNWNGNGAFGQHLWVGLYRCITPPLYVHRPVRRHRLSCAAVQFGGEGQCNAGPVLGVALACFVYPWPTWSPWRFFWCHCDGGCFLVPHYGPRSPRSLQAKRRAAIS